ncbi:unnamed protein product [Cunninghamella blakesleeana]
MVSILMDAMIRHYSKRYQVDPLGVNCFFLRKSEKKRLVVEIQDVKVNSKGVCFSKASVKQHKDKDEYLTKIEDYQPENYIEKVIGIFIMGNMENEKGVTSYYDLPSPFSQGQNVRLVPAPDNDLEKILDFQVCPSHVYDPKITQPMEAHLVMSFKDKRPIDAKAAPYLCDMLPHPPKFLGDHTFGGKLWCATLELEIQFKKRIASKTKRVDGSFITHALKNNRYDLDGWLWDEDGDLLLLTRQHCLCLPWERNVSSAKPKL